MQPRRERGTRTGPRDHLRQVMLPAEMMGDSGGRDGGTAGQDSKKPSAQTPS